MLEDPFVHLHSLHTPRASLVLAGGGANNPHTEIWMGGAHSLRGDPLEAAALGNSWLIDCAGDLDPSYRGATGRWLACVFPDLDGPLSAMPRITDVVSQAVVGARLGNGDAPQRLYVMCQHGMNRSGLVSGLILRGLGLDAGDALERISAARPGALGNAYFRSILLAE